MGETRTYQFSVSSRTLGICYDMRITLTPDGVVSTVHPMDGPSFRHCDELHVSALDYLQRLFTRLERVSVQHGTPGD